MSTETLADLNVNTLIGYTEKRGTAWHYRADLQGDRPNHFEGPVPIERARELLGFQLVEGEVSASALTPDGVITATDPKRKAVIRVDTGQILGVFKKNYQIHHPEEWLVDNVDLILDGGLNIGSVIVLKGGAVVALQAELEETREAAEGVKHRPFLTAATSHDGSIATTYMTGTTVVVCDNTLSAALGAQNAEKFKVRHSSRSLDKVHELRMQLGLVVEAVGDAFDEKVKQLTSEHVSDARWREFVAAFTNPTGAELEGRAKTMVENKAATLWRLWDFDERVSPWRNNAYGVLAAVNTATHHEFAVKNATRPARNAERMVTGEWDAIDTKTLRTLAKV